MINQETICAISTAPGAGGVAVIRVSGTEAITICDTIFTPKIEGKNLQNQKAYTLRYGSIRRGEELIDDVLIALFRAPHSFTGEDTVEITCHGSVYIQQQILQLLIEKGCRSALPGEYTQRAFLNGKMDLSQAEAVADLIASTSAGMHKLAINQMRGGFSNELTKLRSQLLDFTSLIELELDFSEEDVEFADRTNLKQLATGIDELELKQQLLNNIPADRIYISAKQQENTEVLKQHLIQAAALPEVSQNDVIVTNIRHYEALTKAHEAILRVINGLEMNISGDFLSQDIRECMHYLGEITGQISNDEILGNIFGKFCIGK